MDYQLYILMIIVFHMFYIYNNVFLQQYMLRHFFYFLQFLQYGYKMLSDNFWKFYNINLFHCL